MTTPALPTPHPSLLPDWLVALPARGPGSARPAMARTARRQARPQPTDHAPTPQPPMPRAVLECEFLDAMARSGCVHSYPAHAPLMREHELGDSIFIILHGRVKVFSHSQGREVVLALLGPGEFCGELSLDGQPRSASVMTLEPTDCVLVQGWQVRQVLAEHPGFAMQLVLKLIRNVREGTAQVKSLATVGVYGRIRQLLLDAAIADAQGQLVPRLPTQQEIADRVGCSREMVSRVFCELLRGGYVRREGRALLLLKDLPLRW